MFSAFLDSYVNIVKNLQILSLDVSIYWHNLHQDAANINAENAKTKSYRKYLKVFISRNVN